MAQDDGNTLEKHVGDGVKEVSSFQIATHDQVQALCDANPLPKPTESRLRRWLSAYRRLFLVSVIANIAAICTMIGKVATRPGSFTSADATTAVAANLFVTTVMRHEHAVNTLFRLSIFLSRHLPLCIRRHTAKVYSYGGLHSGCGLSAALWYIFFVVLAIKQFRFATHAERAALTATMALMLLLFVMQISISILPAVRSKLHDLWEATHRYGGWAAIAVIWTQIILLTVVTAQSEHQNAGILLVKTPAFWFLVAITCMIVYPWSRSKKKKLSRFEVLSSHAIQLWFDDCYVDTCVGIRLSKGPLSDYHGFATIPNEDGKKGYSVIVSRAGDFTSDLIQNPPTHLWTRGVPTIGAARVGLLFQPLVFVATGSGIGPCLSFLQPNPGWPVRVIWSTRDPLKTYGERIINSVLRADPDAIIINTSATGRTPLLALTYSVAKSFGAEGVVIISNPSATYEVVDGLESRKNTVKFGGNPKVVTSGIEASDMAFYHGGEDTHDDTPAKRRA